MKALVYTQYGSPDVLHLQEVAKPTPKDNEALVKVHATSINSADLDYLRGTFLIRIGGFRKPMYRILGTDIAGRVEAVGKNVTRFKPGDEVYGDLTEYGFGAFAEYVAVPEQALARKPAGMSFEQAAAVPTAGIIALHGVRNKGHIQPGQRLLINGAGGGAGTFAVQLAKYFGAEVTGVDSAEKLDMLRSIGADHVMDYKQDDFTKTGQQYDLILDVVAYRSIFAYRRALTPGGTYGLIGGSVSAILQAFLLGAWISKNSSQNIGLVMVRPTPEDLDFLRELLEAGNVSPVIDKCVPFNEIPEALLFLESGHAKGKVVISIAS